MYSGSVASGLQGAARVLSGQYSEQRASQCDVTTIGTSTHWLCPHCRRFVRYDYLPYLSPCGPSHKVTTTADGGDSGDKKAEGQTMEKEGEPDSGSDKKRQKQQEETALKNNTELTSNNTYNNNDDTSFDHSAPTMDSRELEGLVLILDFVSEAEEASYMTFLDHTAHESGRFEGWKDSQQGKRKQDYGPQANFKKKKVKLRDDLKGMPLEFKEMVEKVESALVRADVGTVHFAPAELVQSYLSSTLTPAKPTMVAEKAETNTSEHVVEVTKEKEEDKGDFGADRAVTPQPRPTTFTVPAPAGVGFILADPIITGAKEMIASRTSSTTPTPLPPPPFITSQISALEYLPSNASFLNPHIDDTWLWGNRVVGVSLLSSSVMTFITASLAVVDVPLPRRSMFVLSGPSRYVALHGIRTEHIKERRISITIRELAEGFVHEVDAETLAKIRAFCLTYA